MIRLAENTITKEDVFHLINWLKDFPRLTKGEFTEEFERKWSKWLGVDYSVMVNSGSSANLIMLYALKLSGRLPNNKVIVPAVCWSTTISPLIQLGFEPIICDVERDNLGLDPYSLSQILQLSKASAVIAVHTLGIPSKGYIEDICKTHNCILLEDSCESVGSTWKGRKTGTIGLMSTFSYYYGHHISTIEGGMVCTSDPELYKILKMIRSHGWSRDLSPKEREALQHKYQIDDFDSLYTFYYPGYNVRSTDLSAKIGLLQLERIDETCKRRTNIFSSYQNSIENYFWKINPTIGSENDKISAFAYPIIHPHRNSIVKKLVENHIECRPLVCGSIQRQPAFRSIHKYNCPFANETVYKYGFYVPIHSMISEENVKLISEIVNKTTNLVLTK